MRRFYFDEEESGGFDNYKDTDDDEEMEQAGFIIPVELEAMHMANFELASARINQKILASAIKTLQAGWLWRFYSTEKKINLIKKTFDEFARLIGEEVDEE